MKSVLPKILIYTMVFLLIFFSTIIYINIDVEKQSKLNSSNNLINTAILAKEYIDLTVEKSNEIEYTLSQDSDFQDLVEEFTVDRRLNQKALNNIVSSISHIVKNNDDIDSISVFLKNDKLYFDSYSNIYYGNDVYEFDLPNNYYITTKNIQWMETLDPLNMKEECLSLIYRSDRVHEEIDKIIYISVNFKMSKFRDMLNTVKVSENAVTHLYNYEEDIIISNDDIGVVNNIKKIIIAQKEKIVDNIQLNEYQVDDKKWTILFTPADSFNGVIVHSIPDDEAVFKVPISTTTIVIFGIILLSVYILLIFTTLKKNISKPVKQLIDSMKIIKEGNLSTRIAINDNSKFDYVYKVFDEMAEEIENIMSKLYEEEIIKNELELKVLQEKINPHFLYNTLDTINWIAKEHEIDEISKMVLDLSTMYRMTFNMGKDLISIKDMLAGIGCYLSIQRVRYGESFNFEYKIDKNLYHLEILNLVVQTLVENAIIHGMKDTEGVGRVEIIAKTVGSNMEIVVKDNGIGMHEEKLLLIQKSLSVKGMKSESGLKNVQRRIKLYYGEEYGLSIESKYTVGTQVTLNIPLIRSKE